MAGLLDQCAKSVRRALPAACVLCGAKATPRRICAACERELPRLAASRCRICALPLESGDVCGACLTHPPHFDIVRAPFAYAFPVDALVRKYKYGSGLSLAPLLTDFLSDVASPEVDRLLPMPLAAGRLIERGFNQAQEIARALGKTFGIAVTPRACRKVTETPPQAALPWQARARNVRGTFVCEDDLSGLRVAIVDDVMTTGATVNELARVVKRAGARRVEVWVLARTLREDVFSAPLRAASAHGECR